MLAGASEDFLFCAVEIDSLLLLLLFMLLHHSERLTRADCVWQLKAWKTAVKLLVADVANAAGKKKHNETNNPWQRIIDTRATTYTVRYSRPDDFHDLLSRRGAWR